MECVIHVKCLARQWGAPHILVSVALYTFGNLSNDITLAKPHSDFWIRFLEHFRKSHSLVKESLEVGVGH